MRPSVHTSTRAPVRKSVRRQSVCNPISVTKPFLCAISGFRHKVDENRALLGYWAASRGNSLTTFRYTYLSHLQGTRMDSWPLKMGQIGGSETSVRNYHYSPCNNLEERSFQLIRCGSLNSGILEYDTVECVTHLPLQRLSRRWVPIRGSSYSPFLPGSSYVHQAICEMLSGSSYVGWAVTKMLSHKSLLLLLAYEDAITLWVTQ